MLEVVQTAQHQNVYIIKLKMFKNNFHHSSGKINNLQDKQKGIKKISHSVVESSDGFYILCMMIFKMIIKEIKDCFKEKVN